MTWLYVPGTSCPSAPASEGSNSASHSPCMPGERLHAASATWRGKQLQPQAWSRRWTRGGFIRLLSGLTCSPSTLARGVDAFISSLPAIPARTIASQESGPEPKASDSSHPRLFASPESAGLILSSEKTYRGMQRSSFQPSSQHWNGWATALRQEYSARPRPAIPCAASDCSSWPGPDATNRVRDEETLAKCATFRLRNAGQKTVPLYLAEVAQQWRGPNASMAAHGPMSPEFRAAAGQMLSLDDQASHWMAPNVPNGGRSAAHAELIGATLYHGDKKVQLGLEHQASNWPGPANRDWRGSSEGSSEGSITRQDGKSRADMLDYAAEQFFRPPSSPDQPIAGGSICSTDGPNSNQPSAKRKLNPIFVEALMRWPTGLSGFERQEMAWTRWWLLMPSFVSMLCLPPPSRQDRLPI